MMFLSEYMLCDTALSGEQRDGLMKRPLETKVIAFQVFLQRKVSNEEKAYISGN